MYKNYYKKLIIKNVIIIALILLFAVFATYKIYYKFRKERTVDYNSSSLEITFHEKSGDQVSLTKVIPVTDAVGLSSKSYTFTVKNNLTIPVNYKIKLVEDVEAITDDNCGEKQIPKEVIKVSLKDGKNNKIYGLNTLEDNTLKTTKIKALGEKDYTVRIWTNNDATASEDLHYHGKIQIVEENSDIAKAK
ncbi:MAG: hypothetical protein IJF92_05345 [Bacilli bacterium]|nr:hypothetical protein [Bacilli bacterium]